jgi:hypothetical protein
MLTTPNAVLHAAADHIERAGWAQPGRQYKEGPCGACADVAINSYTRAKGKIKDSARELLAQALPAREFTGVTIWGWNDAPERTKDEVVAKLRAVAGGIG